jgi:hypothetical protein
MQAHIRKVPSRAGAMIKWLIVLVSFVAAAAAFYTPPYTAYRPEQVAFASPSAPDTFSNETRARLVRSIEKLNRHRPASRASAANSRSKSSGSGVNVTGIRG